MNSCQFQPVIMSYEEASCKPTWNKKLLKYELFLKTRFPLVYKYKTILRKRNIQMD